MLGEHLKQADKYILQNDFDAAELEVDLAIDLDPNNAYALAYLERVKHFRLQDEEKKKKEKGKTPARRKSAPGAGRTPDGTKTAAGGSTILIVDDEPDFLGILRMLLLGAGYEVVPASSPKEAIEKLTSLVPDIILCDINFGSTEMDGFSVYERVRTMPGLVAVPFIFITAEKDDQTRLASLELGVDDFILKPFNSEMLLAAVAGKIGRFRKLRK